MVETGMLNDTIPKFLMNFLLDSTLANLRQIVVRVRLMEVYLMISYRK